MKEALEQSAMIVVDVAQDPQDIVARYGVSAVPTFKVAAKGAVKACITDGAWEADIPENIAPVMTTLIHTNKYDK